MSPFVRRPAVRHPDRLAARGVALIALAVYSATFVGVPDNPQGETAFQSTSALGRTGGLALGGTPEAERLVAEAAGLPPGERELQPGVGERGDRWYGTTGVGLAALGLPFYYGGRVLGIPGRGTEAHHARLGVDGVGASEYFAHLVVGWRNPLLGALTAWLVVLVSRRLGARQTHAWLAGLAYALSTFAWPRACGWGGGVQATFLLFLAFHLILRLREGFERLEPPRPRELLGLGSALALAGLTSVAAIPGALVLGAALEVVLRRGHRHLADSPWTPQGASDPGRSRTALTVLVPIAAGLGVFLGMNLWRFGAALETGNGPALGAALDLPHMHLALGALFLSPGEGLVWMAPLVLLAPLGALWVRGEGERLYGRVALAMLVAAAVPAALVGGGPGTPTHGPGGLLTALPFLWVGVALALERVAERPWSRVAASALAALGLLVQVPGALVGPATHRDLAVQAARAAWPDPGVPPPSTSTSTGDRLGVRLQWDWGLAAPWAQWRILRHRVAGLGERFPLDTVFQVPLQGTVEPTRPRLRGYGHLAWVDLARRLEGPVWPGVILVLVLGVAGVAFSRHGLDPTRGG